MKVDTFFTNFELLTDAPNATAKLRELILQLAVMGKLVKQDPNDEPAQALIERIQKEKKSLVKQKKIPKTRELNIKIDFDDVPYKIPENWLWVNLAEIGHDWGQKKPDIEFTYIDVSSINKEQGIISNKLNVVHPSEAPSRARKIVNKGTVIYSTVRPYLLNIAIIDRDFEPEPIVSTAFAIIHPFEGISNKYIYYYLRSKSFIEYVESQMLGMAYPAINDSNLFKGLIPLPPLAEQKRIVEKCDRLMSLCDQIEKQHKQKQDSIVRMNEGAIAQLLYSQNPDDFRHHWERICNNFDLLYSVPETIPKLRQAILQLAVMGKLVKQDPNDEPAAVLLERIKAEQQQLSKTKRIKQTDLLKSVDNDEFGANLPQGWVIEYLGNLVIDFQNGISKRKSDEGKPIPVLRLADIKNGQISEKSLREIALTTNEIRKYKVSEGDILVIRVNGSSDLVGQFIPCFIQQNLAYCDHLIRMKIPLHLIDQKYLCIFAKTLEARNHISAKTITTAGQKTVNQIGLSSLPVPLPPLAEQKRIVEKCDRLMSLCDTLEAKLKQGRESTQKLMEVAAKQVLLN